MVVVVSYFIIFAVVVVVMLLYSLRQWLTQVKLSTLRGKVYKEILFVVFCIIVEGSGPFYTRYLGSEFDLQPSPCQDSY